MPSRNVVKIDLPNTLYHVYARGHGRMTIYRDDDDFRVFFNLFKRYLGTENTKDPRGRPYMDLHEKIELNCYCLMPNHFHLLLYQSEPSSMKKLMHAVTSSYSKYFNNKYGSSGALFETTYKASIIGTNSYILYISRYIHRNPKDWHSYNYSSLPYYIGRMAPEWLRPQRILDLFTSGDEYVEFISDIKDYKSSLDDIKSEIAGE